ncbi:MAG: Gfo/Idh/MocA family oxidoreductase [Chloroflexota bacterium]
MRRLNVGMIGGGFMGKAHSLAYAGMPMCFWPPPAMPVRKMIAERSTDVAREEAERFGFESYTDDWRRLVNDPAIDIVDIVTPNNLHADMAIAAAEAGKMVLCEKPLARTTEESKRMLAAVEKAGVVNQVAFSYRRTPAVTFTKKLIEDGTLGEILNFRGTYLQDWSADPLAPLSWRFDKEIAGSGTLGDIATHVVDFARYLIGEITAVNSMLQHYITERPIPQEGADQLGGGSYTADAPKGRVDVDDEVMSFLRFENGVVGSLEATRNAHGRRNALTYEIHGREGSVYFDYERRDELQVYLNADDERLRGFRTIYLGPTHPHGEGLWPIPALGIGFGETKIIDCYEFFKAIVEGQPASPDFRDGYHVSRICDAIVESAKRQQWVELEWTQAPSQSH